MNLKEAFQAQNKLNNLFSTLINYISVERNIQRKNIFAVKRLRGKLTKFWTLPITTIKFMTQTKL